jgi:polyribonucleotide nucleotidyltransferase
MDFKVAGTRKGITAIQLDVKVEGITLDIAKEALERARLARNHILDVMEQAIASPREELSPYAPRIEVVWINPEKIGLVIGPGGKMINGIRATTGAEDIQIEDNGKVVITGTKDSALQAREAIQDLTHEYAVGERVTGTVSKVLEFGAVVDLKGGKDGLVHISELSDDRVENVGDIVKVGDEATVIIKEIDERGRMRFSLKDAQRAPQP